jgi:hypothetical protein
MRMTTEDIINMHDNKKRKVMETFRNAKMKRDLLLHHFDEFLKERGLEQEWIEYRKNHPMRMQYKNIDKEIAKRDLKINQLKQKIEDMKKK